MKAVWRGTVIAESSDTVVVEGNHYFPADSLDPGYLVASDHTSRCFWKGQANYFSLRVGDEINVDAAWYYPDPLPAAEKIRGRVAFWKGVQILDGAEEDRSAFRSVTAATDAVGILGRITRRRGR